MMFKPDKKLKLYDVHTHKKSTNAILNLNEYLHEVENDQAFSVGIHPWWIDSKIDEIKLHGIFKEVEQKAQKKNCVFIGETGIDRAGHSKELIPKQIKVFIWHMNLAKKLQKPLIIHCVKGHSDILEILKKIPFNFPLIFHDFNGQYQVARELLKFNSYFSYGDKLFRPNSKGYKSLNNIPIERILLETDDSNKNIYEVYQEASKVLQRDVNDLIPIIANNLKNVLKNQNNNPLLSK